MFILRRVTSENIEINWCLGKSYILVLKERNDGEFCKIAKRMKWDPASDGVYGFVTCDSDADIIPLHEKSLYFIMASDGKTVANISMYR